jgi:hypothetical protein
LEQAPPEQAASGLFFLRELAPHEQVLVSKEWEWEWELGQQLHPPPLLLAYHPLVPLEILSWA